MTPIEPAHIEPADIDTADLHLLALAEVDASLGERAHLAACAECAGEYLALRQIVQRGRAAGSDGLLPSPEAVWAGIHSELGLSEAVRRPPRLTVAADAATRPPMLPVAVPARVLPLPRRRWVPVLAAVGVVGLVGGIAIGVAGTTGGASTERVIAEATLEALPGWSASGSAIVEESEGGRRAVLVDLVTATSSHGGLREVWLLKPDTSGLISIGFLDGSTGRFTVPVNVDLHQYPLVDVSVEAADEDPAHSGDSIVRGELHSL
jgi:hypothetical protein